MTLILPWLPIVLAVGAGSRLLDRPRGMGLGILGAVFWVVLIQAVTGPAIFAQTWTLATLAAGAAAIVAIGAWSGSMGQQWPHPPPAIRGGGGPGPPIHSDVNQAVTAALTRFDDWLETHRYSADPWPEFGELVRTLLYDLCGATHVHPYRMLSEDDRLVPLRAYEPGDTPDLVSAREGIVGHVATTGRSYLASDQAHGPLVDQLAEESGDTVAWCFAIEQGPRRIGLVRVERLNGEAMGNRRFLETVEGIVCLFWTTLGEVCRRRVAETRDAASGLLTREPFLIEADRTLSAAYAQNEPVAVAVFAIEGTRALCDCGEWELADKLIAEASALLEERIRSDDRLGRFDDSRFVLLLRRVDSALGRLIVEQLLSKMVELCADRQRWGAPLTVRCGLSGSGTDTPILSRLISQAVSHCNEARLSGERMASDLRPPAETVVSLPDEEHMTP